MNTMSSLARDTWHGVRSAHVTRRIARTCRKRTVRGRLLAIAVLALVSASVAIAQTDPFLGTWK